MHAPPNSFSLWGFFIWGDFGPFTMWRDHWGQVVCTAKAWPDKPPSPAQLAVRAAFSAATTAWNALAPAAREQWTLAARRASLCATGYNLFLHWHLTGDDQAIATLERQTSTTLLP